MKIFQIIPAAVATAVLIFAQTGCGSQEKPLRNPKLSIVTIPEGASVSIVGKERGKTPFKCSLPPTVYVLKLSLPGFKDKWLKIEAKTGKNYELRHTFIRETASVLIAATADKKSGVTVIFNGKTLGETPLSIPDLAVGKYHVELRKLGYAPRTVSFAVTGPRPPEPVTTGLLSNQGNVSIDSIPGGADVFLNGKQVGSTPYNERLEEGTYKFTVRRAGYSEMTRSLVVLRGKTVRHKFAMAVKKASVKVVSTPAGARLFINGNPYPDTPSEVSGLTPGRYAFKVEKEGFDPEERNVTIAPGSSRTVHFSLTPNTGGIDITTNPPGITIYLDGKEIGVSQAYPGNRKFSKTISIRKLAAGRHTITATHKRAVKKSNGKQEIKTVSVNVEKGKTTVASPIELWIPNARLTLAADDSVIEVKILHAAQGGVTFQPQPGVSWTYTRDKISKIEYIKDND